MGWFNKDKKKEELKKVEDDALLSIKEKIDPRQEILKASNIIIGKFKMFCSFFNNPILSQILEQTEFISAIFEKNSDLNYNKLEQFHYYYTDNLIELLIKLKKGREENIIIINEKYERSKKKLEEIKKNSSLQSAQNPENTRKKWAAEISEHFIIIYRKLCNSEQLGKMQNIKELIDILPTENVYLISDDNYQILDDYQESDCYSAGQYLIQRKLMGKLNKNVFNIEYKYVFKSPSNSYIYVFQIKNTGDWFIYVPAKSLFKLVDSTKLLPYVTKANSSNGLKAKEQEDHLEKIEKIKIDLIKQKSIFEPEILEMLQKFLDKINETELLNDLSKVDVDRKFIEDVLKMDKFNL